MKKPDYINALNAFLCSFILSMGLLVLLTFMFEPIAGWGFLLAIVGFSYWFYKTNSKRTSWGRTFIGLGIESLLLPLVLYLRVAFGQQAAGIPGVFTLIGGAVAISVAILFGVLLGAIFLVAGYFTLRSKR